jgi:hypothetical protein
MQTAASTEKTTGTTQGGYTCIFGMFDEYREWRKNKHYLGMSKLLGPEQSPPS